MSATFHNQKEIHNQYGQYNVHGNVYNYMGQVARNRRQRFDEHDSQGGLDGAILSSLAFSEMNDRRRNVELPHRQTCQWIYELDEYRTWVSAPVQLLWIKGNPGSGKSTLMSHLYSALRVEHHNSQNPGVFLEFFFTARGTPLQRSPLGLFRSLVNQIFYHDPEIRGILRTPFLEKRGSFGSVGWEWRLTELEELFTSMLLDSARRQQVVILVDALDEAGKQAARNLARYFHLVNSMANEQSAKVKICVASRPYHIPLSSQTTIEIYVDQHNQSDIALFVQDYVNNYLAIINDASQYAIAEREGWQAVVDYITAKAKGIFQWVRLMMLLLEDRIHKGDLPNETLEWLARVPPELGDVYKYIIDNVIEQEDMAKALQLFQWVCLATRPLNLTEIRHALAVHDTINCSTNPVSCHDIPGFVQRDEIMRKKVKAWSGGLIEVIDSVTVVGFRPVLQPIHFSVNTFILTRGLYHLSQYHAGDDGVHAMAPVLDNKWHDKMIAIYHSEMYWTCIKYMAINLEPHRASYSHTPANKKELEKKYPLARYAVSNTILHARESKDFRGKSLNSEAEELSKILAAWANCWATCEQWSEQRIHRGTTILHFAVAADLDDLTTFLIHHGADVNATDDEVRQTPLHTAASRAQLLIVKRLIDAGSDVAAKDRYGRIALTLSAGRGDIDIFCLLLGHNPSLVNGSGDSDHPLYSAALYGKTAVVKVCIDAQVDVDWQRARGGTALYVASQNGRKEIVQLLLQGGANVNIQGGDFGTALQVAAYKGNIEGIISLLLEAGADVNAKAGQYCTALQAASFRGHKEVVQLLLDSGADVNIRGGYHGSALQAAIVTRHEQITQLLIDEGANINAIGGIHGTALQAASHVGQKEMVLYLLSHGAEVDAQGGARGTSLIAASFEGHSEIVQLLLGYGANVNLRGRCLGTPLIEASGRGHTDLVQLLIDRGPNIHTQAGRNHTALQSASRYGHGKTVLLLLNQGAEVNAQGGHYGSALQAASWWDHREIILLLINAGADVNLRGENDTTLQAASYKGYTETVQLLLDHGADVHAPEGHYGMALQAACHYGHEEIVQLLLNAGADANARGCLHDTALHMASSRGYKNIVQRLLNNGADISIRGEYNTPLHAASCGGHVEIVQLLLKQGIDINNQGQDQGTALYAASQRGRHETVQYLLDSGAKVNIQGGRLGTPLQAASWAGCLEIVELLIEAGADINAQAGEYGSALQAATVGESKEIVQLLIEKGADVNLERGVYGTALRAARKRGYDDIAEILLRAGAVSPPPLF